jgi:hypothetical protein
MMKKHGYTSKVATRIVIEEDRNKKTRLIEAREAAA